MVGVIGGALLFLLGCAENKTTVGSFEVRPSLEYRTPNGSIYNPYTQSLLRTNSILETVKKVEFAISQNGNLSLLLNSQGDKYFVKIDNLPMSFLIPRILYSPSDPPSEFDAYNLMLAEYARSGVGVPYGTEGDERTHFKSNLTQTVPWILKGDYDLSPNEYYRPLRVGVVNNCLRPGLWELNAKDRSGEIYHSWFQLSEDFYLNQVAQHNNIKAEFVKNALVWEKDRIPLQLDKLRRMVRSVGKTQIYLQDAPIGFSSQDSRRKLDNSFARLIDDEGRETLPDMLSSFHKSPVIMPVFEDPGIYSIEEWKEFDFSFLASVSEAEINIVEPLTSYNPKQLRKTVPTKDETYIELIIELANNENLILGNLPLRLLVEQEDYIIYGFGIGILNAGELSERRELLFELGHRPSYAYLTQKIGTTHLGLNSHDRGIEQVFIRSRPTSTPPHWEITITSYERITDIIKYNVEMPQEFVDIQAKQSRDYIAPIYFSYRDDNVN